MNSILTHNQHDHILVSTRMIYNTRSQMRREPCMYIDFGYEASAGKLLSMAQILSELHQ